MSKVSGRLVWKNSKVQVIPLIDRGWWWWRWCRLLTAASNTHTHSNCGVSKSWPCSTASPLRLLRQVDFSFFEFSRPSFPTAYGRGHEGASDHSSQKIRKYQIRTFLIIIPLAEFGVPFPFIFCAFFLLFFVLFSYYFLCEKRRKERTHAVTHTYKEAFVTQDTDPQANNALERPSSWEPGNNLRAENSQKNISPTLIPNRRQPERFLIDHAIPSSRLSSSLMFCREVVDFFLFLPVKGRVLFRCDCRVIWIFFFLRKTHGSAGKTTYAKSPLPRTGPPPPYE